MTKDFASATAEKTVEEVIDGRVFGNLSKLVPLVILLVGLVIALVTFWVSGATVAAADEAFRLIGAAVALAVSGGLTTYLGKSQTQLDLQAARAANTVPVGTEDGAAVGALPVDSPLVHGNFKTNRVQAEAAEDLETEPVVTAPVVPVVEPAEVDPAIRPGE